MRVTGGTSRGRRLAGPRGHGVRPTRGLVKEALFNILAERVPGARFLDLFAGTGTIGIEALSRGARQVTFVESSQAVCRMLRANIRTCGLEDRAEIRPIPVARFLKQRFNQADQTYDIVFVDPPYHTEEGKKILPSLGRGVIIQLDGVVVIEHFHKTRLADRIGQLALGKSYRYGDTRLSVYRRVPAEDSA
jgi:16S rRNA (guanine(966)-N(2))-methyltransferase RsmD